MAVYSSLLLEAGGGIINRSQQAERNGDAVVAIGLGGTGTDALMRLKSEIYETFKPDNPEEAVPRYSNLKFLAVDSDAYKIIHQRSRFQLNKETEYFDISVPAIAAEFEEKDMLRNNPALTWLNHEEIMVHDAANGAGGIRQVGRYLLIKKADELKEKLKTIINEACRGCRGEFSIHLFAGISGGTGSGTFIDVCYILRHILEELGIHNAKICGYFFLPDVNLFVPGIDREPFVVRHLQINGYAALKELDYLMNLQSNRDEFVQDYGEFSVRTNRSPVDRCYLISSTTADGVLLENGYSQALNTAVYEVIDYLQKTNSKFDLSGKIKKIKIDFLKKIELEKTNKKIFGAYYGYSIVGGTQAVIPVKEISTYLASRLFEKFQGMYTNFPTEGDLNAFVENTGLGYCQILAEVQRGVHFHIPIPEIALADLAAGRNACLVTACDNWNAAANAEFQKNVKALTGRMEGDYHRSNNLTSLTEKVYNALCVKYVTSPEYGPFFVKHLLYSNVQRNLINFIDGHLMENNKLREAERRQEPLRRQELEDAEHLVKSSNVFNRGGRGRRYIEAMQAWYIHLTKIEMYNYMETVLAEFKRGITELNHSLFNVLTTVLDTLKDTFALNTDILICGQYGNNRRRYNLLDVEDIRDELDHKVEQLDTKAVMISFLTMMMKEYPKWIDEDEKKIALLVSDFMNSQFHSVTRNQTILDFLQIKGPIPHGALEESIEEFIFNEQMARSEPQFWLNMLVWQKKLPSDATLSVPFNCAEIVSAAENFAYHHQGELFTIRKSMQKNRISMRKRYDGVPLFAYQGIQELERSYENDTHKNGVHLYEKGEKDWRTYLPSPIPVSFRTAGYHNESMDRRLARLNAQLQQAKDSGIVVPGDETGQYFFFRSKDFSIEEITARFNTYKKDGNIVLSGAEECRDQLQEFIDHMYDGAEKQMIPNDGASDYRESTFLDYYCKYPAINEMVAKELEKKQPLLDLLARIEKDIAGETSK